VLPLFLGDATPDGLPALSPRVVLRQDQPYGDDGIKFSLEQCAKRVAEGRLHPDLIAWTRRRLAEAGNPKGAVARARVLLAATRGKMKNGRWCPDPTDAEFMPAAKDMVETCKGGQTNPDGSCALGEAPPMYALGDCDDLSLQLGSGLVVASGLVDAMLLSATTGNVGVYSAIVGHAYTREKQIEHVLCAVWGEDKWWYCDPSMPNFEFGYCKPYTRERAIYVPSLELACDADVCLAPGGAASGPPPLPTRGDFVGLGQAEPELPPDARGFRYLASDNGRGLARIAATLHDAHRFAR